MSWIFRKYLIQNFHSLHIIAILYTNYKVITIHLRSKISYKLKFGRSGGLSVAIFYCRPSTSLWVTIKGFSLQSLTQNSYLNQNSFTLPFINSLYFWPKNERTGLPKQVFLQIPMALSSRNCIRNHFQLVWCVASTCYPDGLRFSKRKH